MKQRMFLPVIVVSMGMLISGSESIQPAAARVPTQLDPAKRQQLRVSLDKLPLSFEANLGQTDRQVKFLSRGRGHILFLTPTEAVLVLTRFGKSAAEASRDLAAADTVRMKTQPARGFILRMKLRGARDAAQPRGLEELPGKVNYFVGNDPAQWRTNVPTYAKVEFRDVYPGVNLVYYGNQRELEYDFVVAPGADPRAIRLGFEGADGLELDAGGDLIVHAGGQRSAAAGLDLRLHHPRVYQEFEGIRREVLGRYVLRGQHEIGFEVSAYDARKPLLIDPVLSYSTYLGGSRTELANGIAVDTFGNAYVTGQTSSPDFPTTVGAFDTTCGPPGGQNPCDDPFNTFQANSDAFVVKLNPTGSTLVYSTFLGGRGIDRANAIAVDAAGNAYVTGGTISDDFPTTASAFQGQRTPGTAFAAFVTKLNASGSALLYSTFLSGETSDEAFGIAVDPSGRAYITGQTYSARFPQVNAFQGAFRGFSDAFVAKLDPAASGPASLVYSTYLGGTGADQGLAIAVDAAGNAYVTGSTCTLDFPITLNAFQVNLILPCDDAFVTKLNAQGTALVYSTYLGGSDRGNAIAVDSAGNAYVTGQTNSGSLPLLNALQPRPGGNNDAFVTRFSPTGALVFSTYLGGNDNDTGNGIALDPLGNIFVVGTTSSINFPTTNPIQAALGGGTDVFVTKINPTGSAVVYSTYLGGGLDDKGNAIAVDLGGSAYIAGQTGSPNWPTATAFQGSSAGGLDAFVAKLAEPGTSTGINLVPTLSSLSPATTPPGGPAFTLTINGANFVSTSVVRWNGSDRQTTFVSDTQLQAAILASDIATEGTAEVTVFNPAPGGGTSNSLTFTIVVVLPNPIPGGTFVTFIPYTAFGGGYVSQLFLTNLTANTNAVTINRIAQTGRLIQSTPTTLQPAATLLIADSETQRSQPLTAHWFAIASERPIAASVVFDFDSQSIGLSQSLRQAVGALASPPLSAFTAPVRFAGTDVTVALALVNVNASATTVNMLLLDQNGNIAARDSVRLTPFAQTAFVLHDRTAFRSIVLAPGGFVGSLAVTTADSSKPVSAMVVGSNFTQLYSLPVVPGVAR